MSNFRKVNDDILKEWLLYREDEFSSLTCDEDKEHWVYFDEISDKFLILFLNRIEILLENNLIFLMIISWIILAIGMRNITGMVL